MEERERKKIIWQALEYEHKERSMDWYWAAGVIAVALAVVAMIMGNFLFAVLIIVAVFAVIIHAMKAPREITFEISERGVTVDGQLISYRELAAFGHDPHVPTRIALRYKSQTKPYLEIPIHEHHYDDIRDYLLIFIDEEEYHHSMSKKIMEMLGF